MPSNLEEAPVETISITTKSRTEAVEITHQVQQIVTRSKVRSGVAVVCSAHTTGGLTVNENADPDVMSDLLTALDRLVPRRGDYTHREGNADAHVKTSLVGTSVKVLVEEGRLLLGTWQGIYFCEFDGPRRRRALVQVLPCP
jgi:secondary thiamine-phosphate synthase enzyme